MTRLQHGAQFKAKVVVEAIRGLRPVNEVAARFWSPSGPDCALEEASAGGLPGIFASRRGRNGRGEEGLEAELHKQIGRLKMELEWLKRSLDLLIERRRELIDPEHGDFSLRRQGWEVNEKRVRRLLRLMWLQALYPKPKLSQPGQEPVIYPQPLAGGDRGGQPGLERGYCLCPDGPELAVPGSRDGLVQRLRAELPVAIDVARLKRLRAEAGRQ